MFTYLRIRLQYSILFIYTQIILDKKKIFLQKKNVTKMGVRKTWVNSGKPELLHITTCPQENDSIQQQTATRLTGFNSSIP